MSHSINKKMDIRIPFNSGNNSDSDDTPRRTKVSKLPLHLKKPNYETPTTDTDDESDERIRQLVDKTIRMHRGIDDNRKAMDEKLAKMREQINDSVVFLSRTKSQIQNIKLVLERDRESLRNRGDACTDKTIEEMSEEMKSIQDKLTDLRARLKRNKEEVLAQDQTNRSFQETLAQTVNAFNNISTGDN